MYTKVTSTMFLVQIMFFFRPKSIGITKKRRDLNLIRTTHFWRITFIRYAQRMDQYNSLNRDINSCKRESILFPVVKFTKYGGSLGSHLNYEQNIL